MHKRKYNSLTRQPGPSVTSVGGTTGIGPEIAAKHSGGGFSVHFPRPLYQEVVVPKFLQELGSKHAGLFKYVRFCSPA